LPTITRYDVEIRPLERNEQMAAAGLIARAFMDNPTSLASLRRDQEFRLRFLTTGYRHILKVAPWQFASAWHRGALAGVLGMQHPGHCKVTLRQQIQVAPYMIARSPAAVVRSLEGFRMRDENDWAEPHLHLEPLAVEPAVHGAGVGSRLIEHAFARAGQLGLPAYFIADNVANVPFFERLGAHVVGEYVSLGIKHTCMLYEP
jgi:GNAT superfamily N-acetyltransferase